MRLVLGKATRERCLGNRGVVEIVQEASERRLRRGVIHDEYIILADVPVKNLLLELEHFLNR